MLFRSKSSHLREILCNSPNSLCLFTNLFWLYFCLKFQRQSYHELKTEYKREIKRSYTKLFYELHELNNTERLEGNKIIANRLKKLPIIYAWAIIKKIFDVFKKSIAEFNRKFVSKCCQVVTFELQGLCVSDAFTSKELYTLLCDPFFFEIFPE